MCYRLTYRFPELHTNEWELPVIFEAFACHNGKSAPLFALLFSAVTTDLSVWRPINTHIPVLQIKIYVYVFGGKALQILHFPFKHFGYFVMLENDKKFKAA